MEIKYKTIPNNAIKIQVPDTRQIKGYTCGASALQAICGYYGVGPDEEEYYVVDMKMKTSGSDPKHIIGAVKKYGLKYREIQPMNIKQLKSYLFQGKPVMIMLQAWPLRSNVNYKKDWKDGHWVVAIGYDTKGVYFEDPSLAAIRGFIKYAELKIRWHDIAGSGKDKKMIDHYGLVIWKPRQQRPAYVSQARYIP